MKTFRITQTTDLNRIEVEPSVVAVGFFDGVHRGHQKVIGTALEKAAELQVKSAVMTFDPHPSVVLKKGKVHARYITPLEDKKEILEGMGVDYLFVVAFSKAFAALSPQQFVDDYFISLHVRHVVAGFDFSFGYKGEGSMDTLQEYAKGRFSQTTVEKLNDEESKISSTRIRSLLDHGDVYQVKGLLSRPFTLRGIIKEQDENTLMIYVNDLYYELSPGAYAVRVTQDSSAAHALLSVSERHPQNQVVTLLENVEFQKHAPVQLEFHNRCRGDSGKIGKVKDIFGI